MQNDTRKTNAKVTLERIRKYANARAPFVGIPIVGSDYRTTVVLRREHLLAACACPGILCVRFNPDTNVITFNGGSNKYALRNLKTIDGQLPWLIRKALEDWARGKRKQVVSRICRSPESKRTMQEQRIERYIARLHRELLKVRAYRPSNPCIEMGRDESGDYSRSREARWHEEKNARRALGQLAARKRLYGEPRKWNEFYRAAEVAARRMIQESQMHDRVCNRKRGPERDAYLTRMHAFIGMADKPEWAREACQTTEQIERYRQARVEYLGRLREQRSIESQIAELEMQRLELVAGHTIL